MERLYIKAINEQDCEVISALLQDSIFKISACDFDEKNRCLCLLLNRFCWEHSHKFNEEQCYHRVHSGLYIHNVINMKVNKNFRNQDYAYMNLLAVYASSKEINLLFSGHKHLYIEVDDILIYLKDLHEKYPTLSIPIHNID